MLKELISQIMPSIIEIRHQLHQIPELKFSEFQTAALICEKLTSYGYQVQTNVGKTGLVALLDTGRPGKTIALRADMDALPLQETTGVPYQSKHEGVMHACGHDGHCATLLAVAWVLQQIKTELNGQIKLIFQPAEEGGKGSLAMIKEGVLENPRVDCIFGYHNWPGLPLGVIGVRSGTILAGNGRIEIMIHGKMAHTAMPEESINPVIIGAALITELEKLRKILNPQTTVFNITHFNGGHPNGSMSDQGKLIGLYYIDNDKNLEDLKSALEKIVRDISISHRYKIVLNFFEFHPPTVNSPEETELVSRLATSIFGREKVHQLNSCLMVSEDFSEYLGRIPGCFFLVGAGLKATLVHTANFDFNDTIIPDASHLLCQIVVNLLDKKKYWVVLNM